MPSSARRVYFKTFGCRTNLFDTQVMIARLGKHRRVESEAQADTVVINSCTVTNAADSGVRSYINRLRRRYPGITILFTGCAVQSQGEKLFETAQVDGLFDHGQKEKIAHFITAPQRSVEPLGAHLDETLIERFEGRQRAFVKIQEGCDFRCSYCIIPSVRGPARSYTIEHITTQITRLVEQGFEEFILTGTNTGSFGRERGERMADLLKSLFKVPGIKRLRLGSLEPSQVDDALMEQLTHPLMARHLHIALQHTSDAMLARMNRINRFSVDRALLDRIAQEGFTIGSDYIVGFPGESDAIFDEALKNLQALPLTHIHLFTYSPRSGTPAARLKQDVDGHLAASRRQAIEAEVARKHRLFYESRAAAPLRVLIERQEANIASGLDQYFTRIWIEGAHRPGEWVSVDRFWPDAQGRIWGSVCAV